MDEASAPSSSLDHVIAAMGLAAHQVQAFDPAYPDFDAQRPLLVLGPQTQSARPLTRLRYPPGAIAHALVEGRMIEVTVATLPLEAQAWLLPALPPEDDRASLKGLRGTMERLFGPDGCPWDREQTHETLRPFLIEEVYELVDAIDRGDTAGLREEVGDVLAHMFMQTAIAQQAGAFALEDAVEYARAKFVRRHPHVFGDEAADTPDALLTKWEQIKAVERAERSEDEAPEGALDSVPAAAPSFQRAQALIRRAARAGLGDPPLTPRQALDTAIDRHDWGAALFAVARLAAEAGIDGEETLRLASAAFTRAFQALEAEARTRGVEVSTLDNSTRLAVWEAVAAESSLP